VASADHCAVGETSAINALAGDSIIDAGSRSTMSPRVVMQMFDRIRSADAAFTNFEIWSTFRISRRRRSAVRHIWERRRVLDELSGRVSLVRNRKTNHAFGLRNRRSVSIFAT